MEDDQKPKERKPKRPRGKARLIPGKCIGCERCEPGCPVEAISDSASGKPVIDIDKCTGCRKCVKICPVAALEMYYTDEELVLIEELRAKGLWKEPVEVTSAAAADQSYQGVWVFVEQQDGVAASVSWELLGVGQTLARDLDVDLCAFVLGEGVEHLCQEAFSYGAKKVYLLDDPVLKDYRTEPYTMGVVDLVRKHKPEVVLMGATGLGRDLAGAVATILETGLTADCTKLSIDKERKLLEQTRPAFGGNIMATILNQHRRPQMASVRPHVMRKPDQIEGAAGEIIREPLNIEEQDIKAKVLEIIRDERGLGHVDIAGAEILVSGGRGMQGPENFKILEELAEVLGGTVSASRSAVDAGWMPYERQVGQTGKTVRPKIYIACGISGAIQHLVGMQDSDLIIAVNRDREAPIFEVAHYGIIGDLFEVIPTLTRRLREIAKDHSIPNDDNRSVSGDKS
ncbi:MAG: electron transfer flavoprotein subunit alpha [Deltaproteobacteria bacterium]|nr:electron transfer flavoprotein subunit alpha [Deltaproteobacteria bacterium]